MIFPSESVSKLRGGLEDRISAGELSEADAYYLLGGLLSDSGNADKAAEALTRAMSIFERENDPRTEDVRRRLMD